MYIEPYHQGVFAMNEMPHGFCNKCNNITVKMNINGLLVCKNCGWCESLHQYVRSNTTKYCSNINDCCNYSIDANCLGNYFMGIK